LENNRITEVERDLLKSSIPHPLHLLPQLKHDQLKQVAQDHAHTGFEHLHEWRLLNISGQPVPVFE